MAFNKLVFMALMTLLIVFAIVDRAQSVPKCCQECRCLDGSCKCLDPNRDKCAEGCRSCSCQIRRSLIGRSYKECLCTEQFQSCPSKKCDLVQLGIN
ncbi:hypothetical protein PanWU01x14_131810 [Parasponia andersonii]|uniref:Bowman-Birk serine protease inhibitors family domain-containing protein n=1 Tax=Parasponia andersonii TaxID=3476 RepID=A0A2P5CQG4_PARAD|nr:hypothetical protein PanWU01x14_131810 [Parasponia andersonii]